MIIINIVLKLIFIIVRFKKKRIKEEYFIENNISESELESESEDLFFLKNWCEITKIDFKKIKNIINNDQELGYLGFEIECEKVILRSDSLYITNNKICFETNKTIE